MAYHNKCVLDDLKLGIIRVGFDPLTDLETNPKYNEERSDNMNKLQDVLKKLMLAEIGYEQALLEVIEWHGRHCDVCARRCNECRVPVVYLPFSNPELEETKEI